MAALRFLVPASHLLRPPWKPGIKTCKKLLEKLLLDDAGNRGEAINWLAATAAEIRVSRSQQQRLFLQLLKNCQRMVREARGSRQELGRAEHFCQQLLLLFFESSPRAVTRLLWKDATTIREFFSDTKRAVPWFQHFSTTSDKPARDHAPSSSASPTPPSSSSLPLLSSPPSSHHRFGAKSLAQFAFAHRDDSWQHLVWGGRHAQSPVSVASRPHYFGELDVERTVQSFLRNVPQFWRSEELWSGLEDGAFVSLDQRFFLRVFLRRMLGRSRESSDDEGMGEDKDRLQREEAERLEEKVADFLLNADFAVLCKRLLPLAPEGELCEFMRGLGREVDDGGWDEGRAGDRATWLAERLVLWLGERNAMDDVLLANGCLKYGRQVQQILEENEEEQAELDGCLESLMHDERGGGAGGEEADRDGLEEGEIRGRDEKEDAHRSSRCKWADSSVASFMVYSYLSKNRHRLGQILSANGITFRPGHATEDEGRSGRHRYKSRKKRKKRRRKGKRRRKDARSSESSSSSESPSDSDEDDPQELGRRDSFKLADDCAWKLSLDNFSADWVVSDLPSYLATTSFQHWVAIQDR